MKQIIPFKKELLFKTKVSEITSISLEHTLTLKKDDLISGEFHISGDYKMTEGSINREKFQFKLPFDIALDSRYDMSSIVIDIDNFYYEIINNESLQVNIDVYVEGEKLAEPSKEDLSVEDAEKESAPVEPSSTENEKKIEVLSSSIVEVEKEDRQEEEEDSKTETKLPKEEVVEEDINTPQILRREDFEQAIQSIQLPKANLDDSMEKAPIQEFNPFDNIDGTDTYVTYYVDITKEEDTLEKILTKYNVSKEEVALYNDVENIKPGMKFIIPNVSHE